MHHVFRFKYQIGSISKIEIDSTAIRIVLHLTEKHLKFREFITLNVWIGQIPFRNFEIRLSSIE